MFGLVQLLQGSGRGSCLLWLTVHVWAAGNATVGKQQRPVLVLGLTKHTWLPVAHWDLLRVEV